MLPHNTYQLRGTENYFSCRERREIGRGRERVDRRKSEERERDRDTERQRDVRIETVDRRRKKENMTNKWEGREPEKVRGREGG